MRMGDFSGEMNTGGWQACSSDRRNDNTAGHHTATSRADSEAASSEAESKRARLVRTIESEIVPRLVLTRRVHRNTVHASQGQRPDDSDVTELVRLLMAHDVSVASAYVETVRQRGATLERVCLDLLAPAARRFGLLWEQDECDFMDVTVGLCRLHQLLRGLGPEFESAESGGEGSRRILLVPVPGDQHTFGISLVAQFLRRADWDVWHEFPTADADVLDLVRRHWFAVVGLSVGTYARIDQLAATIGDIRRESRNRAIGVLVGGPALVGRPELAEQVGADATAVDGQEAVLHAEYICNALREAN